MRIKSIFGLFRAEKLDETQENVSATDEDEVDLEELNLESQLPEKCGVLSKWTNYMNGWQDRFFIVKQGAIAYYKSEEDMAVGCRGTVSLSKAAISVGDIFLFHFERIKFHFSGTSFQYQKIATSLNFLPNFRYQL